jgi:hypothetical protein
VHVTPTARSAVAISVVAGLIMSAGITVPARAGGGVEWIGLGDGRSWKDPDNWRGKQTPTSNDSVVFPLGGNVDLAGPVKIKGLETGGQLTTLSHGSLTVETTAAIGGNLSLTGVPLTLLGPTFVPAGRVLETDRELTNVGTLTVSGQVTIGQADPTPIRAVNQGTIEISSGGLLTSGGSRWEDHRLINAGTLQVGPGSNSGGPARVQSLGIDLGGELLVPSGATLRFSDDGLPVRIMPGLSIAGAGTTEFANGGPASGPGTIWPPKIELPAGHTLSVARQAYVGTAGPTTIAGQGKFDFNGGSIFGALNTTVSTHIGGVSLIRGPMNLSGSTTIDGELYLEEDDDPATPSTTIINSGSLLLKSGTHFKERSAIDLKALKNHGRLEVKFGQRADLHNIDLVNSGTVKLGGTLEVEAYAQSAGRLVLASGRLDANRNGAVLGAGTIEGTGTIDGSLSHRGTLSPGTPSKAGNLTVNGALTQTSTAITDITLISKSKADKIVIKQPGNTIAGTLRIRGKSSYLPAKGRKANIIDLPPLSETTRAYSGNFASVEDGTISSLLLNYSPRRISIKVATSCAASGVESLDDFYGAIRCFEKVFPKRKPAEILSMVRQLYYGAPWSSANTNSMWDYLITCGVEHDNPRPDLSTALDDALAKAPTSVADIDVGHLFTGAEALQCPKKTVGWLGGNAPIDIARVDMPNWEASTWGGDIGSAIGRKVYEERQGKIRPWSYYIGPSGIRADDRDLRGDVDGLALRGLLTGAGCQTTTTPPTMPLSTAIDRFYNQPSDAREARYQCVAQMAGLNLTDGHIADKNAAAERIAPRLADFAKSYLFAIGGYNPIDWEVSEQLLENRAPEAARLFINWLDDRMI